MEGPLVNLGSAGENKDKEQKLAASSESKESKESMSKPEASAKDGSGKWFWSKRDRLQRNPSLDKVDESTVDEFHSSSNVGATDKEEGTEQASETCHYLGIKSYLHLFYEARPATGKESDLYEEVVDDRRRLLDESRCRSGQRKCTAAWWKVFVMVGVLVLLAGVISVLLGYLMPQKPTVVSIIDGMSGVHEVIDRQAISYNQNLDACKLIGLIFFCMGGLTLAVALMIPSFLYRYLDDDCRREPSMPAVFAVSVESQEAPALPIKEPLEVIPATEQLTEVQPARRPDEAVLVKDGMMECDEYNK